MHIEICVYIYYAVYLKNAYPFLENTAAPTLAHFKGLHISQPLAGQKARHFGIKLLPLLKVQLCGMNALGSQWHSSILKLQYTSLKKAVLLHRRALSLQLWSQTLCNARFTKKFPVMMINYLPSSIMWILVPTLKFPLQVFFQYCTLLSEVC